MAQPIAKPLICPIVVGRAAYIDALEQLFATAEQGQGQTVLVAGEAGIGKTRLIAEAKTRADHRGWQILEGRCFEPDTTIPYAPIVDLLRNFLSNQNPLASPLPNIALKKWLPRLLPELTAVESGRSPIHSLDSSQDKRQLFQDIATFLIGLAKVRPLLVVLEDIHWSDDTSREFLVHFARRTTGQPCLLLISLRSDELDSGVAQFVAQLERERVVTSMALTPLAQPEIEAMLQALLGPAIPQNLLEQIFRLTEGNPFFVEELLKSAVSGSGPGPSTALSQLGVLSEIQLSPSVQDAVQRRVQRVSQEARDVLQLAAVAGRRFNIMVLRELLDLNESELLARIKELVAAQLVIEVSTDQFEFRHALTQHAVYTDMLLRERRARHRQMAEAIKRVYSDAIERYLPELAEQYYLAEAWEEVLEYGQRLGELGLRLYTPRAAIEWYSRAIEAADRLSRQPSPRTSFAAARSLTTRSATSRQPAAIWNRC